MPHAKGDSMRVYVWRIPLVCSNRFNSFKPFNHFAPFKSFDEAKRGTLISGEFAH